MRRTSSNSIGFVLALAILAYFFLRNGALLRTLYRTPPGVVNVLAALAGLLILGGGAALIIRWWGPELLGAKEEVVSERPSDLPPGLAGALVSEAILPRHILATLFDLAERGALRISEQEDGSYLFERAEGVGGDLRDFERFLLDKLFDSDGPVSSNELGEKLKPYTERLAARMRAELAALALIDEDRTGPPANIRMIALVMLFITFVGFSQMGDLSRRYALIWIPFAALGLVGVGMFFVPFGGDIRTPAGRRAARRWRSYWRFLGGQGTTTALPGSTARRFPDAISFGEERSWARRSAGERVSPSEALNRASEGLLAGLDTASDNLFSMLNHSARALSDSPGLDSLRPPAGPSGGAGFGGPSSGGKSIWSSGGSKSRSGWSGSSFSSRSKSSWSGSGSKSRSSSRSGGFKSGGVKSGGFKSGGVKSGGSRTSSRSRSSFRGSSRKK